MPASTVPLAEQNIDFRLRASIHATPWRLDRTPLLAPIALRPTRREFLIGAGGLLLLAPYGCGAAGEGGDASGERSNNGWPRTVRHALGEFELERPPERVVGLSTAELADTLLALGIEPVGMTTYGDAPGDDPKAWPPAIRERAVRADIASVGNNSEPNLEAVARLEPDLIVGFDYQVEANYEQWGRISPTLAIGEEFGYEPTAWLEQIAYALGREEEAEWVMAEYQARIDQVRPKVEGMSAAVISPRPELIYVSGPGGIDGQILADLGIETPDFPEGVEIYGGDAIAEVSLERVDILGDSEHLFITVYGLEDMDTTLEDYLDDPLWQTVPAVRNGNVHPVQGLAWTNHGPFGRLVIVDEVEAALAP